MGLFTKHTPQTAPQALETRHSNIEQMMADIIANQATGSDPVGIPVVFAAISMIANTAAQLPLETFTYTDDRRGPRLPSPPVTVKPQPGITRGDWIKQVVWSLLLRGDAYLWLRDQDRNGHPREAWVLNADDVSVTWSDPEMLIREYEWQGKPMLPGFNLAHIMINSRPAQVGGLSPITATRIALETAGAAENYARNFWKRGGVPTGWLEAPRPQTDEQATSAKKTWMGAELSPEPALLSGGWLYHQLELSAVDAQFIESRQFSVVEVARMFHIPSPKLSATISGAGSGSIVYQNYHALQSTYMTDAINPILVEIETHLTDMLPQNHRTQFNTDALFRSDITTRLAAYKDGLEAGIYTLAEVRQAEGLPPMTDTNQPATMIDAEA